MSGFELLVLAVAFLLLWAGSTLILSWVGERHHESLTERLTRHQAKLGAWEAQEWLRQQEPPQR